MDFPFGLEAGDLEGVEAFSLLGGMVSSVASICMEVLPRNLFWAGWIIGWIRKG